jgi:hypothetical protein
VLHSAERKCREGEGMREERREGERDEKKSRKSGEWVVLRSGEGKRKKN